jgi:hypothetical protein
MFVLARTELLMRTVAEAYADPASNIVPHSARAQRYCHMPCHICRQKQKNLLEGVVSQRESLQQRLYQAEVQVSTRRIHCALYVSSCCRMRRTLCVDLQLCCVGRPRHICCMPAIAQLSYAYSHASVATTMSPAGTALCCPAAAVVPPYVIHRQITNILTVRRQWL